MTDHTVVGHDEWLAARTALLAKEKEFTRIPRRAEPAAARAPVGAGRKGVCLRGASWERDAPRPVRRSQPVDRLPLHVRAGGRRGLPALLVLGRQLRPERRAPRRPRHDARRRLSRTGCEARVVSPANGLGFPLGLVRRQRLQHRPAASRSPRDEYESRVYNYGSQAPGLADREGVSVFVRDGDDGLPHVLGVCARHRPAEQRLQLHRSHAARTRRGGRQPQFWVRRHDEYGR